MLTHWLVSSHPEKCQALGIFTKDEQYICHLPIVVAHVLWFTMIQQWVLPCAGDT